MPGKGHWDSECQIHICTLARRELKRTSGGTHAQVRLRTENGMRLNFIVWKFRLGSASEPNVCSHCYDVLNEDIMNSCLPINAFEFEFELTLRE